MTKAKKSLPVKKLRKYDSLLTTILLDTLSSPSGTRRTNAWRVQGFDFNVRVGACLFLAAFVTILIYNNTTNLILACLRCSDTYREIIQEKF